MIDIVKLVELATEPFFDIGDKFYDLKLKVLDIQSKKMEKENLKIQEKYYKKYGKKFCDFGDNSPANKVAPGTAPSSSSEVLPTRINKYDKYDKYANYKFPLCELYLQDTSNQVFHDVGADMVFSDARLFETLHPISENGLHIAINFELDLESVQGDSYDLMEAQCTDHYDWANKKARKFDLSILDKYKPIDAPLDFSKQRNLKKDDIRKSTWNQNDYYVAVFRLFWCYYFSLDSNRLLGQPINQFNANKNKYIKNTFNYFMYTKHNSREFIDFKTDLFKLESDVITEIVMWIENMTPKLKWGLIEYWDKDIKNGIANEKFIKRWDRLLVTAPGFMLDNRIEDLLNKYVTPDIYTHEWDEKDTIYENY